MRKLSDITLLGIDCINLERLQLAADISTKEIEFGAVKLLSSIPSDDKRVIHIPAIKSKEVYSDFAIKELYKYVNTEFVLVIQYDGFILNPSAWSDEFLKYDYIGAPWVHMGKFAVGNGGFSLRSKKLISWLADHWREVPAHIHPEDIFIAKFARPYLENAGMRFAPKDLAARFSKEGDAHSVVWNGEFGFHGINYTDISRWLDKHPEYKFSLTYELDDYATLMRKYPIYDGTVYTLKFRKWDMKNYVAVSKGEKEYEVRMVGGKDEDLDRAKIGDTVVFKRSGVSIKKMPVPASERKIKNIERFESLAAFRKKYPALKITPPWERVGHWKRPLIKFYGDSVLSKNEGYAIVWF